MTRNELKQLVRQVLNEGGRVRSSPMGYNASIHAAAEKVKQQRADKAASKKKDDDEFEKREFEE